MLHIVLNDNPYRHVFIHQFMFCITPVLIVVFVIKLIGIS